MAARGLEGEVGVRIGDEESKAPTGSYVFKPRGVPHTFRNPGPKPARLIEFNCSGGMEKYLEEVVELIHNAGSVEVPEYRALMPRYGHTGDGIQWVPDLTKKYGLRLVGAPV